MNQSNEKEGIYVHFPFCRSKCLYCDFYSLPVKEADWERFAVAVENEYRLRVDAGEKGILRSLYLGGGTPSLAPSEVIRRLREMVKGPVGEFTIEVNPEDVSEEKATGWKDAGVNRISMGVQSLDDSELRRVGRRHTGEDARRACDILRPYFDNVSLDLMFGLPGQNIKSLENTIDGFLDMRPEHISAYSLMYEERSALTRLRDAGRIEELPEEASVEMFRLLNHKLREGGYERYEISNYSLPGRRSRHNSNYWKGYPYIGLGPGAHSYDGQDRRSYNIPDLKRYLEVWGEEGNRKPESVREEEILSKEELREELLLTRLRMKEGLDTAEYAARFGEREMRELLRKAERYISAGQLELIGEKELTLTEEGVMISDEIISSLF